MKDFFTARIEWISYGNGGRRKIPPQGTRYCPLIQLYEKEQCVEWSIDFNCPNFSETDLVIFRFLVEDAPTNLIELGEEYIVCEGSKKVAKIQVIEVKRVPD